MSRHYFGNQYEVAYGPNVLRNWEVPKYYTDGYILNKLGPSRLGHTRIISNDRGHLVPGVPRPKCSPWVRFPTTWHLPLRIERETANEISGLSNAKHFICPPRGSEELKKALVERQDVCPPNCDVPSDSDDEMEHSNENNRNISNIENNKSNVQPYVPGDLSEEKQKLDSHNELVKNRYAHVNGTFIGKGYPRYREDFSRISPEPEKSLSEQAKEVCLINEQMKSETYSPTAESEEYNTREMSSPELNASSNFQLAKQLHKQNLDHVPLPDTIAHRMYRKYQIQHPDKEPGLVLDEKNFASGVGWKGYSGYGPTCCTKMKVYRPKTCGSHKPIDCTDPRLSSANSFDKKWRFIKQSKVSPIELALCWDMMPVNSSDEPKPPTHIDGSNGSMAPAVFSLVHTPKDNKELANCQERCDGIHGCGPIFDNTKSSNEKDYMFERVRISNQSSSSQSSNSHSSISKKRAKSAYNLKDIEARKRSLSNSDICNNNNHKDIPHSVPNLFECNECKEQTDRNDYEPKKSNKNIPNAGSCMACKMKNVMINDKKQCKPEFKLAFKAGVSHKRVSNERYLEGRFNYKVPKQKDPYSPKNYAIRSLAPPFSLQKDKRQDYPEHWRLSTVYQHSYKPIRARKRSLLSTIFK